MSLHVLYNHSGFLDRPDTGQGLFKNLKQAPQHLFQWFLRKPIVCRCRANISSQKPWELKLSPWIKPSETANNPDWRANAVQGPMSRDKDSRPKEVSLLYSALGTAVSCGSCSQKTSDSPRRSLLLEGELYDSSCWNFLPLIL